MWVFQQLSRGSILYCPAGIHHEHSVTVDDGVQSVSDGNDSAVLELLTHCLLNERVCLHVHIGSSFIQYQNLQSTSCIMHDCD
jgi:hypothetical protein